MVGYGPRQRFLGEDAIAQLGSNAANTVPVLSFVLIISLL
jgi:hypothetical protein